MGKLYELERKNEILFALRAIKKVINRPVTRIEVQKIIYLTNILAPLKDFILDYFEFTVWHNGPYSKEIQNSLNNLVSRRLVKMKQYKIKRSNGRSFETSKYVINIHGERVINKLIKFKQKKEQYAWVYSIVRLINLYGIDNVVKIVYQEPTFKHLKENSFGSNIPINDIANNKLLFLAKEIKSIGEEEFGYKFDKPEDILLAIFDYLYSETI